MKALGAKKTQERRRSRRGFLRPGIGIVLLGLAHACPVHAEEYRLGVQDKVRIKVIEWRAPQEAVHEWVALNGEFLVGPSGSISLPLVGDVSAAGTTTDELAKRIGEGVRNRVGLTATPTASVEIIQFRPFYILGRVDKPGEFPYRPGLSVMQAVSIAGGLPRVADPALMRMGREIANAEGGLSLLKAEISSLIGRRARLEAELAGASTIAVPQGLKDQEGDETVARILREEQLILRGRQETLRSQAEALNDLKKLLQKEIDSLGAKMALKDKQLSLVRRELEGVQGLVNKGLAVAPRQFSLERAEADVEASRLELETALLRARQDVSRAERDLLELTNKQHNEVLTQIRETQSKLEEANRRLSTAQTLLDETERFAAQFGESSDAANVQTHFSIVRRIDGQPVETSASETSPVEPGDLIKVWITKQRPGLQITSQVLPAEQGPVMTQVP
jgi:polysaccharide export outer membrane protein/exopolysaccharide production protein ExoF